MNEKFSEYLKDLPPELQEKAKDLKTQEELLEFLSDNDVELPEDALEAVSGGCSVENDYPAGTVFKGACPDCGGDLVYHDNCVVSSYEGNCVRAHCKQTGVLYFRHKMNVKEYWWENYQTWKLSHPDN